MDAATNHFLALLPTTQTGWASAERLLLSGLLRADNLGASGTRRLLDAWGIGIGRADVGPPGEDFCHRATAAVAAATDHAGFATEPFPSVGSWAFLEYDALPVEPALGLPAGALPLSGPAAATSVAWVALPEDAASAAAGEAWWEQRSPLRAFPLAVNSRVDRSACAEFRLLSRLAAHLLAVAAPVAVLAVGGLPALGGEAQLFASRMPCLSCLAAMRQFQLLFPAVTLTFASGSRAPCTRVHRGAPAEI